MLSLEQIQRLEEKVFRAVELIKALKEENNILKSELETANKKVEELEQIISDYRSNQVEIEEGIVKAIRQLEDLDSISASDSVPDSFSGENIISGDGKKKNTESDIEESNTLFQNISLTSPSEDGINPDDGVITSEPAGSFPSGNSSNNSARQPEPDHQDTNTQLDIF